MVVCVLLPLLALRAALEKDQNRLLEPIALAPQHDGPQLTGEVSPAAHRLGVRTGMGLGEAVDICPELEMVTPDPARATQIWEAVLARIESTGAAIGLRVRETATLSNVILGVLIVFGGAYAAVSALPSWMQEVSKVLPLSHGIPTHRYAAIPRMRLRSQPRPTPSLSLRTSSETNSRFLGSWPRAR